VIRFTFWNIETRSDIADALAELAIETQCDVLITAETGGVHVDFDNLLRSAYDPNFRLATSAGSKVHVWTRLKLLRPVAHDAWFEAFSFPEKSGHKLLLIFAHLPSKAGRSPEREWDHAKEFAVAVRKLERTHGTRTLVFGDLNLFPYDPGARAPEALNAIASQRMAIASPTRRSRYKSYDVFYNPTWNLLGDAFGTPGTFFWDDTRDWYVLDQVLVRPLLIPQFQLRSLRVVSTIGTSDLVNSDGRPSKNWPDHLPLTFHMDI